MKNRANMWNRDPLIRNSFEFLPLTQVKPLGWWKDQLRIQADGLSGHLPEFWEDLGPNSGWLGGTGESWERGPYYLDGLIPLAYLLNDEKLLGMVKERVDWILESQDITGHFGPASLNDWWPFGIVLKALTQYHEATSDDRVISLMEKFFEYMRNELPKNHMHSWAKVRWADTAISIIWLYNRNGDEKLLDLLKLLKDQGYDWSYHFADFAHTTKQSQEFTMRTHVVNNAMGIKMPAVSYQFSGFDEDHKSAWRSVEVLDKYHGTATGIFTGDEHYAGKDPNQGTELCAVVEYMFSLENMIRILGDPLFGDRLEKIAYNALPGTFSEDMWTHQYDQQANQVLCTIEKRCWTNNGNDANTFGLEPNYGCCTSDYHQGWPKFIANSWMATPNNGLAAIAYGPCCVETYINNKIQVKIKVDTEYPFDGKIKITLSADEPVQFPLMLRIPGWTIDPSVIIDNNTETADPGTFKIIDRLWKTENIINIDFPMPIKTERRFNNSITISRGPIVFSLKIGEKWVKIKGDEPHADYAIHPTTQWNYGLEIDPDDPDAEIIYKGVGKSVYGPESAPVELKIPAKKVPEWVIKHNSAGTLPVSPVISTEQTEKITLIPYGCAKLRITEFPLIKSANGI